MAKKIKPLFKVDTENIRDVEPEEIHENENLEESNIEENSSVDEVIDEVENHAQETKTPEETTFDFSEEKEPEIVEAEKVDNRSSALNGDFLLTIIDKTIPLGLKYGTEYFNKTVKVDLKKLRLDYDEKELLKPSADSVAIKLFSHLTDVQQLLLGLSVIYANKLDDAISKKHDDENN